MHVVVEAGPKYLPEIISGIIVVVVVAMSDECSQYVIIPRFFVER